MEQGPTCDVNEREINIKLLFLYILTKWRNVLVLAIVCTLLGVAYKGYKLNKNAVSNTSVNDTQELEKQKNVYKDKIEETNSSIEYINKYIETSVYAKIDPNNQIQTTARVSIQKASGNDNLEALLGGSNNTNQIVQAYASFISNTLDLSKVASNQNLTVQEVRELISASANFDSDTVFVTVIGTSSDLTESIMNYVLDNISVEESTIKALYGEHNVITTQAVTETVVNSGLLTALPASGTTMTSNNVAMSNALARKSALEATLAAQNQALASLSTSNATNTSKVDASSMVKYGILSFVGGIFLAFLFYTVRFMSKGIIFSEDDINDIYHFKTLAVLPMNLLDKRLTKFDKFIYRKIDSSYGISTEIAVEKAIANILGTADQMKSCLLVGTDVKQDLSALESQIQSLSPNVNYNLTVELNANSKELQKLKNADGVILVTERNATRIDDLSKSVETINNWKKEIIGSIVL